MAIILNDNAVRAIYAKYEPALDAICSAWQSALVKLKPGQPDQQEQVNTKFGKSFKAIYSARQIELGNLK